MSDPAAPRWEGPLDPRVKLHEALRLFSNWTLTARLGVSAALHRRGLPGVLVVTLADAARLTRADLLASHGVGPKTVRFVAGALDRAGLEFAPDAPAEDLSDEALLEKLPRRRAVRSSAALPA